MTKFTQMAANEDDGSSRRRIHLREISGDADAPLETVGQDLRAARIRRGDDLAAVSRALKIRKDHLDALESDRQEDLPGKTYAIGFVRSYARYLGLDVNVLVDRFKAEVAGRGDDHALQASSLHDDLAALGARMIVPALEGLAAGTLAAVPQPEEGVTYAAKLTREDGRLDWSRPADCVERQVRALTPWPGCWFDAANGERIKVLAAEPAAGTGTPGTLLDDRLTVACADGAVRLVKVQRPGKAPVDGAAFLRGFALAVGQPVSAETVAD